MNWRAALIGCGRIGSEYADDPKVKGIYSHAGAYAVSQRAELIAVCDADAGKSEQCARRWGLKVGYREISELLEMEKPQIVSICTPDFNHADVLRKVLSSNSVKGVLAEKPLALNVDEAKELCRIAEARGIVLAVNYVRRYADGHRKAAEDIARGVIGQIRSVTGTYSGGLMHNGSHWFDLVRWLVSEVVSVQGFNNCESTDAALSDAHGDSNLDTWLEFANGARGYLCGYNQSPFFTFELDIFGTSGRVRITDSGHRIALFEVGNSPHYSGYKVLHEAAAYDGGLGNVMVNAVEDLIDCVETGRQPYCSGRDGVAALQIAEAVRDSTIKGTSIRLDVQ